MENYRTGTHTRYSIKYHFVASSGNVTDEVIQEYIRLQDETTSDDSDENFRVS